jgi:hypothetical protein
MTKPGWWMRYEKADSSGPPYARRLHGDGGHAAPCQPIGQGHEVGSARAKGTDVSQQVGRMVGRAREACHSGNFPNGDTPMRATNDVTAPSRDQVKQRASSTTHQPVTSTRGPDRAIRDRSPHRSPLSLFLSVVLRPGRMPQLSSQSGNQTPPGHSSSSSRRHRPYQGSRADAGWRSRPAEINAKPCK